MIQIVTSYGVHTPSDRIAGRLSAVKLTKRRRPDMRTKGGKTLARYERFIEVVMREAWLRGE